MATSGTATFNLDIIDIIEEAYEIIGGEGRGGYDMRTARRSLDLLTKEWANRGLNMWTLRQTTTPVLAGTTTINLPADTVDILDATWRTGSGTSQQDTILTRFGGSEFATLANKNQVGVPSRFYVYRTAAPTMRLWPSPTSDGTLFAWGLRLIEDTGAYTNTMDIPARFLPALTYGLAYHLAIKTPSTAERIPGIKSEYDRQFDLAAEEDRDRASFRMTPDLSSYNR